jgi:hypothetical protein
MKTTAALIQELVDAQRDAGKDPQFTIGYLMAFMAQMDAMSSKKQQAINKSDLQYAVDVYRKSAV